MALRIPLPRPLNFLLGLLLFSSLATGRVPTANAGPHLEASPSLLEFGNWPIQTPPSIRRVTLRNTGDSDLRFTGEGLRIWGENETDFNRYKSEEPAGELKSLLPFTLQDYGWRFSDSRGRPILPASQEQTVSIAFEPTSPGREHALLEVSTNDPEEPRALVDLYGTGYHLGDPTPVPPLEPGLTFPVFFNPNNGHWYGLDFERRTWRDAQNYVSQVVHEGYRGHLATLTSREELDWVMENVPLWGRQGAWIGGRQSPFGPEPDHGWEWITGETWDFTNWNEGEPNEIVLGEDFLLLWIFAGGTWNDNGGERETVALVEFGAPEPTPTPTGTVTPTPSTTPEPSITPTRTQIPPFAPQHCDSGYYVLDAFGGRHRAGNPPLISGSLFFGEGLAQDLERADVAARGSRSGKIYEQAVLDTQGTVHYVARPWAAPYQDLDIEEHPDYPQGRAVDLVVSPDGAGFWVLTDYGGIYRAGSALPGPNLPSLVQSSVTGTIGFDVTFGNFRDPNLPNPGGASIRAVALAVIHLDHNSLADGYIILDSQGGHYPIAPDGRDFRKADAPHPLLDPTEFPWPYFFGLDIARDLELFPTQEGAVILDGFDGIHPVPWNVESNPVFFATNRTAVDNPSYVQLYGLPYVTSGADDPTTPNLDEGNPNLIGIDAASIFVDVEFSAGCGHGLYTMDKYGGVFALGTARKEESEVSVHTPGSPYFFPFLYAKDLEFYALDESSFETGFNFCETCFRAFVDF
jgi:hypothetical protein